MNKKILFSPVGGTDPMSEWNYHDGALIHIARHYKPDVIYLYMSKEIFQKHEKDDRYRYCIKKLGERLSHVFEVEIIERRELEMVQLFDPIYADFEVVLDDITKQMDKTDELLLNISSGTPAMKSALLVLATMLDITCQCIQVDTPTGKMNQHEHSDIYDPEERWELNPDNDYKPGDKNFNRTHTEKLISLKRLKYEEVIKKYVLAYDYHAALILANNMKTEDTASYLNKLKLAEARQKLDFNTVDVLFKTQKAEIYSPVRKMEVRKVYEYMLVLQARVAKAEYSDFVRGLSPLLADLFEKILLKQTDVDISDFTVLRGNMVQWDMDKLYASEKVGKILNEVYNGNFMGGWIKSAHLVKLIESLIYDSEIIKCVTELRKVEETVRNMAAHNMISVSDEWIKKNTGYFSKEIIKLIKKAFSYTSYNIRKEYWDSYDDMNRDIINAI